MEANGVVGEREICMELCVSKWLCENSIFGQLFNKDVEAINKVNPNNFSILVQYCGFITG